MTSSESSKKKRETHSNNAADSQKYQNLFQNIRSRLQIPQKLKIKNALWTISIVLNIILVLFAIIFGSLGTFSEDYTIEEVEFTTEISYNRAIANRDLLFNNVSILPDNLEIFTVKAYLIRPTHPKTTPMPGIVWQHGMVVNREINLHNALDYASAGFCVLVTSLPGHSGSGGLWDFGLAGIQVIWSGVEYLAQIPGVDPEKIAVSGHSNGGIVTTRAGIFDDSPLGTGKIKAVGAIYALSDLNDTTRYMVGENILDDPDWGVIIASFTGCTDGIITTEDSERRSIAAFINNSNIPNYFLMTGDKDELTDNNAQFRIFEAATGNLFSQAELRTIADETPDFVISNLGYNTTPLSGEERSMMFANGTARQLRILHGQNHVKEVANPEFMQHMVDWMILSLDLDPSHHLSRLQQGENVNFQYMARFIGWFSLIAGTILFLLNWAPYWAKIIFPRKRSIPSITKISQSSDLSTSDDSKEKSRALIIEEEEDVLHIDYIGDYRKFFNSWKEKLGYMLFVFVSFTLGISLSWQINQYFLNFWILNQYILQYTVTGIFLFLANVVMYLAYKKGDKHTRVVNLEKIGLSWQGFRKSILFIIGLFTLPFLTYNILAKFLIFPLWYPRPYSGWLIREVSIAFALVFLFYFSLEVISKTQLFERPYQYPNWKGYFQEIIINGSIIWFLWIASYTIGGLFMNPKLIQLAFSGTNGGMILIGVNMIMILTQGMMAYLSAYIYQRTKNIFSVALMQAFFITFVISGQLVFIYSVV